MSHDTSGLRAPASETIIRTQDEGWSVTLSAVHGPAGWGAFTVVRDDHPPLDMLGDAGGYERGVSERLHVNTIRVMASLLTEQRRVEPRMSNADERPTKQ